MDLPRYWQQEYMIRDPSLFAFARSHPWTWLSHRKLKQLCDVMWSAKRLGLASLQTIKMKCPVVINVAWDRDCKFDWRRVYFNSHAVVTWNAKLKINGTAALRVLVPWRCDQRQSFQLTFFAGGLTKLGCASCSPALQEGAPPAPRSNRKHNRGPNAESPQPPGHRASAFFFDSSNLRFSSYSWPATLTGTGTWPADFAHDIP